MNLFDFLSGQKTYWAGAISVALGVLGFYQPEWVAPFGVTPDNAAQFIQIGILAVTLRAGISKIKK